jgi:hypothetical protein
VLLSSEPKWTSADSGELTGDINTEVYHNEKEAMPLRLSPLSPELRVTL